MQNMKNKKLKLSTVLLLVLGLTAVYAQEAIPASGGNASGSGGSESYTIGQVVYTTNSGTNGSVAQGVQQTYEISVVTGLPEAIALTLICTVYPNPAKNRITLKTENYNIEDMSYRLYDNNGKLIENKKVEGRETLIDMSYLVISTYFLKVIENNKEVKTFKIIKN